MKTLLLKPSAVYPDTKGIPRIPPKIVGADSIVESKGKLTAKFAGINSSEGAYLFFEDRHAFTSDMHFVFEKGCKRLFFFRAERFQKADLAVDITVEQDAAVDFIVLLKNEQESETKIAMTIDVKNGGNFKCAFIHLNSGRFAGDFSLQTSEERAHAEFSLFNLGRFSGVADYRIENICDTPFTSGKIVTRSILMEKASSRIQAIPVITKSAHDAENHLDQMAMLLSPEARSESVPLLSVANNAVRASHRSSVARLTEEDLFYLNTRGIGRQDAEKLLLNGFLHEIVGQIPTDSIRNCATEGVQHFLEHDA